MKNYVDYRDDFMLMEEQRSALNNEIKLKSCNLSDPRVVELNRKLETHIMIAQLRMILNMETDRGIIEKCNKMLDKYTSL